MWIFTSKSFLSAVKHRDKQGVVILRARLRGHLESFIAHNFPDDGGKALYVSNITETPKADYRFRVEVNQSIFAEAAAKAAASIEYDNFKNSIESEDYHNAAFEVWQAMWSAQCKEVRDDLNIEDTYRIHNLGLFVDQEDDGEVS